MGVLLIDAPVGEPVTLDQVKTHLRIEGTAEDSFLSSLIKAARQWGEAYTGRAFMAQGWALHLDRDELKARQIALPKPPLLEVTGVTCFDEAGRETVFDEANYYCDFARCPGRLVLREGAVWPQDLRAANAVKISFQAGYGEVPEPLKLGIRQLVACWYENRGDDLGGMAVPSLIRAQFLPYRILRAGA